MNDNTKDIEQVLQDLTFDDAIDRTHKDLLEQKLLLHFNAAQPRHVYTWRSIMNTKTVRFAAAAVILIGVFVGLQFLDGTSNTIWAQVREQVAAAKAVVYKAKVDTFENGQPLQLQIEATLADEINGTRMDIYMGKQLVGRTFTLAEKKSHVSIFPAQKKYIEVELTEENRIENGRSKAHRRSIFAGRLQETRQSRDQRSHRRRHPVK